MEHYSTIFPNNTWQFTENKSVDSHNCARFAKYMLVDFIVLAVGTDIYPDIKNKINKSE